MKKSTRKMAVPDGGDDCADALLHTKDEYKKGRKG